MSPQVITLLGTILSGGGAAAAAVYFVRIERKRAEEECEKRFAALREGMKLGKQ